MNVFVFCARESPIQLDLCLVGLFLPWKLSDDAFGYSRLFTMSATKLDNVFIRSFFVENRISRSWTMDLLINSLFIAKYCIKLGLRQRPFVLLLFGPDSLFHITPLSTWAYCALEKGGVTVMPTRRISPTRALSIWGVFWLLFVALGLSCVCAQCRRHVCCDCRSLAPRSPRSILYTAARRPLFAVTNSCRRWAFSVTNSCRRRAFSAGTRCWRAFELRVPNPLINLAGFITSLLLATSWRFVQWY